MHPQQDLSHATQFVREDSSSTKLIIEDCERGPWYFVSERCALVWRAIWVRFCTEIWHSVDLLLSSLNYMPRAKSITEIVLRIWDWLARVDSSLSCRTFKSEQRIIFKLLDMSCWSMLHLTSIWLYTVITIACTSCRTTKIHMFRLFPNVGRFNERLVLSLASNRNCILMDDELNILPTSTHVKDIHPIERNPDGSAAIPESASKAELKDLVTSLQDTQVRSSIFSTNGPSWFTLWSILRWSKQNEAIANLQIQYVGDVSWVS